MADQEAWARFLTVARLPDDEIDLARDTLALATVEYPGLDASQELAALDSMASVVRRRLGGGPEPLAAANTLSEYLFDELGFGGNREDYYDPRNSYLNEVLRRRVGIPITLSLLYIEVGKRAGLPFVGVGMPGHFLVRHRDVTDLFVDPFHGGILLSKTECRERLRQVTGPDAPWDDGYLAPVGNRDYLARMVRNLKGAYARTSDFERALRMTEWLMAFDPSAAAEVRDRGLMLYRLGRPGDALHDLRSYLDRAPGARDAGPVRRLVAHLENL
jgi:regulator of sirC expression with transglutaminase-like and TPR domain